MNTLFQTYGFAKKFLFTMDAETAHEATMSALQKAYDCKWTRGLASDTQSAPLKLMGLSLRNPVGLAAGLDKDGAHIDALGNLGFGFIEVGTVTPKPQPGNPKPRMFRLPQAQALINRMGFNNQGLDAFVGNVMRSHYRQSGGILGLNIGKNADTPMEHAARDYLIGLAGVYPHADYVTVNISSPNTKNLRELQTGEALDHLLGAIAQKRQELVQEHNRYVPIAIKIAPDVDDEQIAVMTQALLHHQMDAVIATNTTITRDKVQGLTNAEQAGGLSGAPVHEMSLAVIANLRQRLGPDFPIIGVGGIVSGQYAKEKVQAGANVVQLYTGLVYRGPALIGECVKAMSKS